MNRSHGAHTSHADLLTLGVISLWLNLFGVGFLLLRLVNGRIRDLPPDVSLRQVKQLKNARALAHLSIVLFVMSWIGLIVMVSSHSRR